MAISKPPFGTPFNPKLGISKDMVFALPLNEGGGLTVNEIVDSTTGTLSGGATPAWNVNPDPFGPSTSLTFNGGGEFDSYIDMGMPTLSADLVNGLVDTKRASFFFRFRRAPFVTGGLAERNDGTNVCAGWAVGYRRESPNTALWVEYTAEDFREHIQNVNSTDWHNVLYTYDSHIHPPAQPFSVSAPLQKIYLDGLLQDHAVGVDTNSSGLTCTDAGYHMYIGKISSMGGNAIAGSWTGEISCVGLWSRVLNLNEAKLLNKDPWAFMRTGVGSYSY